MHWVIFICVAHLETGFSVNITYFKVLKLVSYSTFICWLTNHLTNVVPRFQHGPCMFNARRSQSNPIELQSFEWLRLGLVIELNWTHPKMLPIEHNRTLGNQTLKQSNIIIKHCMQQSNIKPVSSGFKQKALCSNKLRLHFQTRVHKNVTEGRKRKQVSGKDG